MSDKLKLSYQKQLNLQQVLKLYQLLQFLEHQNGLVELKKAAKEHLLQQVEN